MALGFIIFGWPKRTKTHGPTIPEHCPNCDNDSYFYLFKSRRWFSLYFIPFLPLGFANRFLLCGVCQAGLEIDRPAWKRLKSFTRMTKAFDAGEIADSEYLEEFDGVTAELWGTESDEFAESASASAEFPESPA